MKFNSGKILPIGVPPNAQHHVPDANAGLPPGACVTPQNKTREIDFNHPTTVTCQSTNMACKSTNMACQSNGALTFLPENVPSIRKFEPESAFTRGESKVQRAAHIRMQTQQESTYRPALPSSSAISPAMRESAVNFFREKLRWNTGPFDCEDDWRICCLTSFCAPAQYVSNLNILTESKTGYRMGKYLWFFLRYSIAWSCYVIWLINMISAIAYLGLFAINYGVLVAFSCCCMSCLGKHFRTEIREKYDFDVEDEHMNIHCCCHFCAVCQESRFLSVMRAANVERVRSYCDIKRYKKKQNWICEDQRAHGIPQEPC